MLRMILFDFDTFPVYIFVLEQMLRIIKTLLQKSSKTGARFWRCYKVRAESRKEERKNG